MPELVELQAGIVVQQDAAAVIAEAGPGPVCGQMSRGAGRLLRGAEDADEGGVHDAARIGRHGALMVAGR